VLALFRRIRLHLWQFIRRQRFLLQQLRRRLIKQRAVLRQNRGRLVEGCIEQTLDRGVDL